jgi:hypothetical protein
MFSPNPAQRDYYGDAVVIYNDGKEEVFPYPRMYALSIPEKYVKERYRKFYERAHLESSTYLWMPFAQRIANLSNKYPGNPPKLIRLRRYWRDIAAPGTPQPSAYNSYMYYQYQVLPEDLTGVS